MNAPLNPVHSPFGGSLAGRILRCPASVGLVEKVSPHLRKSSIYAERGTVLHAAMALLIERERQIDDLAGTTIDGYTITEDDIETALRPVLVHVERLLDMPGASYYIERRIEFPGIAGAFGTVDLIVHVGAAIFLIDFKFGAGVRVLALYPDGDDDVVNAQLLFYAAAARHTVPEFFAGVDNITLTILQPQSIDPDAEMESSVDVTHAELDQFIAAYTAACAEALSESPRLARGPWCRFCPARPICPDHTKPLLDLAQFTVPTPAAQPSKDAYLQVLADGLNLLDAVKNISKALHDQAKRALDNGDVVPGYALTKGRAERHWRNERTAIGSLMALGLFRDDVVAETMRSPRQVEIRAKKRGVKVPPEFIVSARSGTSLVKSENAHIPVPSRDELARTFTSALQKEFN